jgi:hypothetical protein
MQDLPSEKRMGYEIWNWTLFLMVPSKMLNLIERQMPKWNIMGPEKNSLMTLKESQLGLCLELDLTSLEAPYFALEL